MWKEKGEGGGGFAVVVGLLGGGGDWSKIMIEKRKMPNSKHRSPDESHIFPLNNGCGLTTHELIDISHLRTFMV